MALSDFFGGGEAGFAFDFTDISTLYEDTGGTDPVDGAGDTILYYQDQSGNGNHQANSGSTVTLENDGTRNYADFGGLSTDYLNLPSFPSTAYVYLLIEALDTTAVIFQNDSLNYFGAFQDGSSSTALSGNAGSPTHEIDGATPTTRDQLHTELTTGDQPKLLEIVGVQIASAYKLGGYPSASFYLTGKAIGILVIDRVLSASEINSFKSHFGLFAELQLADETDAALPLAPFLRFSSETDTALPITSGVILGLAEETDQAMTFGVFLGVATETDAPISPPKPYGWLQLPGMFSAEKVVAFHDWSGAIPETAIISWHLDIEGDGLLRIPVRSWQATLRADASSYLQAVIPNYGAYSAEIAPRLGNDFLISRRATLPDGSYIEQEMARAPADLPDVSSGPVNHTCVLSGYSVQFSTPAAVESTTTRTLQQVRSANRATEFRVRCAIDWFLRPGQNAIADGEEFTVKYINFYVNESNSYMDAGGSLAA